MLTDLKNMMLSISYTNVEAVIQASIRYPVYGRQLGTFVTLVQAQNWLKRMFITVS